MHYIKQGQGCRIKAVLLTPTGEVSDLRRSRYISAALVLPSGATMPCRDLSFNEVANTVCVRLLGTRELVKIGKYGIVFNVKLEDGTMYSTPVVYFAEVKEDADAGYHELTLSLSISAVNFPDNVSYTGASPQIGDKNTWLVYDDNLNAYVDTGIEVGYAHLLSRYDGQFAEITAAEEKHERAEQQRKSSEGDRVTSERSRIEAEGERTRAEKSRVQSEKSRDRAESERVAAEQGRVQSEQSRERAETSRANAEQGRVKAEGERDKRLGESVAKAETAAGKADTAAEAVMQLPIVRTDLVQEISPEGQALARENISAVGALPVALTLAGDNTLSVASTLADLSAHYKLYAARPGAYRWAVVISDASGGQVEEMEVETISADGVLHLVFRSQVLGQTYDLALTIAADAVSGASVALWRRTEQAGANTTSGGFLQNRIDLDKYAGNRGLEVFFRTGSDVSTRQHINSNEPLSLLVSLNMLYVNLWGLWANSFRVDPDTDYHVVVSFEKDKLEASLYVNGEFVSARRREDAAPVYSAYNALGCTNVGSFPFKGTIYHTRLFNFAPTAEDVVVFYNNGDPTGYVVPAEMKSGVVAGCIAEYLPVNMVAARREDFPQVVFPVGSYTASRGVFAPNNSAYVTVHNDQPAANGFSGDYARFEAIRNVSLYCGYWTGYLRKEAPIRITLEYRSNVPVYQGVPHSIKLGDANEGTPEILSFDIMDGAYSSTFGNNDINPDAWLEIRVLSIDVAEGVGLKWYDSARQLPVNGNLPPLWKSAGGYDLTASGTPEIVYKSLRRENTTEIAEVLAQSECSLEARIARLEKALIDLTSGRTFIPKLTVKELEVWGDNNLILTGEGAPTKAPDRAGQIYIDTKNNAQYRSTGNTAVSDWKNA